MEFEVYKGDRWPTWLVRVGDDVYEMDERPTWPNGVNMYAGRWDEWKSHCAHHRVDNYGEVPMGLVRGIVRAYAEGVLERQG